MGSIPSFGSNVAMWVPLNTGHGYGACFGSARHGAVFFWRVTEPIDKKTWQQCCGVPINTFIAFLSTHNHHTFSLLDINCRVATQYCWGPEVEGYLFIPAETTKPPLSTFDLCSLFFASFLDLWLKKLYLCLYVSFWNLLIYKLIWGG